MTADAAEIVRLAENERVGLRDAFAFMATSALTCALLAATGIKNGHGWGAAWLIPVGVVCAYAAYRILMAYNAALQNCLRARAAQHHHEVG